MLKTSQTLWEDPAMSNQAVISDDLDSASLQDEPSPEALTKDQMLSIIFAIARLLATERDLETMFFDFLSSLIETFEAADAGVMRLYDANEDRLIVKAAQGYHLDALRRIPLSPGETTSGKAFQSGQVELFPDPESILAARANMTPENRELYAQATDGMSQSQSLISMPLITDYKVGTLTLENRRRPGSFSRNDLPFWQAVADLIALAIDNARLAEELQEAQALAEANRLKAELISTLAHEMRTPLTSIKGYSTAMLMEEASFGPETQREFLQIIDEECDVLQDLIRDLLESSIIDAGLLRIEPQPVRLPLLARNVVDDIAPRAQKHHLILDFPDDFPIIDADPQRIAQVLRNLVDNAVKYSPDGGLVVVQGRVDEHEVIISVADQGVGIAPEDLNRLFEKFFRVKSGLGRHVVGSGLGLPIAHTLVESHGGRIWAESTVGKGTTLYFTLPLRGPSQELPE
jgi:signal transduction histidine kinase